MAVRPVTLTFTGDDSSLSKTFDAVGGDATKMGGKVGKASKDVGSGFARMGEGADIGEQRIIGLRDAMTGAADVTTGFQDKNIPLILTGFADMASSVANFAGPVLGKLAGSLAGTTLATNAAAVAQGALNVVMSLNPIGLVVIALAALVGAFVLAWKHSETFRDIVRGAMDGVAAGVGVLARAMGTVAEIITAPYRLAFRAIKAVWNNTVGGFGIPSIKVGPFSTPGFQIPRMHSGGVVPGVPGTETLALLQAGERVTPAGGGTTVVVNVSGVGMGRDFGLAVAQVIRDNRLIGVT